MNLAADPAQEESTHGAGNPLGRAARVRSAPRATDGDTRGRLSPGRIGSAMSRRPVSQPRLLPTTAGRAATSKTAWWSRAGWCVEWLMRRQLPGNRVGSTRFAGVDEMMRVRCSSW